MVINSPNNMECGNYTIVRQKIRPRVGTVRGSGGFCISILFLQFHFPKSDGKGIPTEDNTLVANSHLQP